MSEITREQLAEALERMEFSADDTGWDAAMCLLASAHVGPNIKRIATLTGLPRERVAEFSRNLRESGIWQGGRIHANWGDEEDGWLDFVMDTLVADGSMERVP